MTPEQVKDILRKKLALQEASNNTAGNPNSDEVQPVVVEETPNTEVEGEVTEAPKSQEEIKIAIQIHKDEIAKLELLLTPEVS